jgi:hypothetical protein
MPLSEEVGNEPVTAVDEVADLLLVGNSPAARLYYGRECGCLREPAQGEGAPRPEGHRGIRNRSARVAVKNGVTASPPRQQPKTETKTPGGEVATFLAALLLRKRALPVLSSATAPALLYLLGPSSRAQAFATMLLTHGMPLTRRTRLLRGGI